MEGDGKERSRAKFFANLFFLLLTTRQIRVQG